MTPAKFREQYEGVWPNVDYSATEARIVAFFDNSKDPPKCST